MPPTNPCPSSAVTGADVLGTLGALNDTGTAVGTVLSETGADVTGAAGGFLRAAPYAAAAFSGVTLLHGYYSGNSEQKFSGYYGIATLLASAIPVAGTGIAIGMALAKIVSDTSSSPDVFEMAATLPPSSGCVRGP